jgi:hypothetical protein
MSHEKPKGEHASSPKTPYEHLEELLGDEVLQGYVTGDGPLTLAEVDPSIRGSDEFERCVERFGWPETGEQDDMSAAHEYESDEAFWLALWDRTRPHFLNNFKVWLRSEPTDQFVFSKMYGSYPAVHRAYALSHDFFTTLSEAHSLAEEEFGLQTVDMSEHDVLVERPSLVRASHAAYKLYARLVKPEDMRTTIGIVAGTVPSIEESPDIKDLDRYFFT